MFIKYKLHPRLEKYESKLLNDGLYENYYGIHLLNKYPEMMEFNKLYKFAKTENPMVLNMLMDISQYIVFYKPYYEWFWSELSMNEYAIFILARNLDKVNWYLLSGNSNAKKILADNQKHIVWSELSGVSRDIDLLTKNQHLIDWTELSQNENAIELLQVNQHLIDFHKLSRNRKAIKLLTENQHLIDWSYLCTYNDQAIELFEANQPLIIWYQLSYNCGAIKLLTENQHLINWKNILFNTGAFELIKQNQDKIDWCELVDNCNAIELLLNNPNLDSIIESIETLELEQLNTHKDNSTLEINCFFVSLSKCSDIFVFDSYDYKAIVTYFSTLTTEILHVVPVKY